MESNFIELVKIRESVRKYDARSVEWEKIESCLEAARLAPSASNSQPWKFVVVDEPILREKIARETFSTIVRFNEFTLGAPIIVVIVIEKAPVITQIGGKLKDREFSLYDIGIVAEHFCLRAAEQGLGTCMLGWFNESPIRELLEIPKDLRIGLVITLGYPAKTGPKLKRRKELREIFSKNGYNKA